ncbi:MAG: hypothetical protein P4L84_07590 [Isosphaeraceae bacterium]|nr:hypothetical protein [Isosphaeraceae bacterium]
MDLSTQPVSSLAPAAEADRHQVVPGIMVDRDEFTPESKAAERVAPSAPATTHVQTARHCRINAMPVRSLGRPAVEAKTPGRKDNARAHYGLARRAGTD